ncbi:hypothetical protein EX30DRAFT_152236 [Ascodesmis nigricans]|uniref:Uncharacterized protein n=1 Tax=Ascodesmis nigricans TaxID=341454 RepID=A0A4S2N2F4_9PEZI|nr:hypothetical protein EX30DRAFT_152236 [Ascodesmis nigricans]
MRLLHLPPRILLPHRPDSSLLLLRRLSQHSSGTISARENDPHTPNSVTAPSPSPSSKATHPRPQTTDTAVETPRIRFVEAIDYQAQGPDEIKRNPYRTVTSIETATATQAVNQKPPKHADPDQKPDQAVPVLPIRFVRATRHLWRDQEEVKRKLERIIPSSNAETTTEAIGQNAEDPTEKPRIRFVEAVNYSQQSAEDPAKRYPYRVVTVPPPEEPRIRFVEAVDHAEQSSDLTKRYPYRVVTVDAPEVSRIHSADNMDFNQQRHGEHRTVNPIQPMATFEAVNQKARETAVLTRAPERITPTTETVYPKAHEHDIRQAPKRTTTAETVNQKVPEPDLFKQPPSRAIPTTKNTKPKAQELDLSNREPFNIDSPSANLPNNQRRRISHTVGAHRLENISTAPYVDTYCHLGHTLHTLSTRAYPEKAWHISSPKRHALSRIDILARTLFPSNCKAVIDVHAVPPFDSLRYVRKTMLPGWPKDFRYYYAVGIHGEHAKAYTDELHQQILNVMESDPKHCIAWGPIGYNFEVVKEVKPGARRPIIQGILDQGKADWYSRNILSALSHKEILFQEEIFVKQLTAAVKLGKPVIIDARGPGAAKRLKRTLEDWMPTEHRFVLHCYSQGTEFAEWVTEKFPNAFIGINGNFGWKGIDGSGHVKGWIRKCRWGEKGSYGHKDPLPGPLQKIVFESCSPFFIPRGVYGGVIENSTPSDGKTTTTQPESPDGRRLVASHAGMIPYIARSLTRDIAYNLHDDELPADTDTVASSTGVVTLNRVLLISTYNVERAFGIEVLTAKQRRRVESWLHEAEEWRKGRYDRWLEKERKRLEEVRLKAIRMERRKSRRLVRRVDAARRWHEMKLAQAIENMKKVQREMEPVGEVRVGRKRPLRRVRMVRVETGVRKVGGGKRETGVGRTMAKRDAPVVRTVGKRETGLIRRVGGEKKKAWGMGLVRRVGAGKIMRRGSMLVRRVTGSRVKK